MPGAVGPAWGEGLVRVWPHRMHAGGFGGRWVVRGWLRVEKSATARAVVGRSLEMREGVSWCERGMDERPVEGPFIDHSRGGCATFIAAAAAGGFGWRGGNREIRGAGWLLGG